MAAVRNENKLVFHISEDGSDIELNHFVSSKTSVKSLRAYFDHLNLIRLRPFPVDLIAQWGEVRVQIPLESTNVLVQETKTN